MRWALIEVSLALTPVCALTGFGWLSLGFLLSAFLAISADDGRGAKEER